MTGSICLSAIYYIIYTRRGAFCSVQYFDASILGSFLSLRVYVCVFLFNGSYYRHFACGKSGAKNWAVTYTAGYCNKPLLFNLSIYILYILYKFHLIWRSDSSTSDFGLFFVVDLIDGHHRFIPTKRLL